MMRDVCEFLATLLLVRVGRLAAHYWPEDEQQAFAQFLWMRRKRMVTEFEAYQKVQNK